MAAKGSADSCGHRNSSGPIISIGFLNCRRNVAVQHSILTAIWHMGRTGELYSDPGADFFARLHPERAKKRALHQLEAMGYRVSLDPVG